MGVMLCMAFKILLHLSQVGLNFLREYFDKSDRAIYFVVSPKPPNACFGLAYPIFLTTPRGSQPDSSNNSTLVSVKVTSYLLFSCPEIKNQEWPGTRADDERAGFCVCSFRFLLAVSMQLLQKESWNAEALVDRVLIGPDRTLEKPSANMPFACIILRE